jgi:SPX domain protein involved in polyphosphate accumulation
VSPAFLEHKENAGAARRKVRIPAPSESFARLLGGTLEDASLRREMAAVPELCDVEGALCAGALRPRLTTWYRRLYFRGDGVRITLDEDLVFSRAAPPVRTAEPAEPTHLALHGPLAVLEVKLERTAPAWLTDSTRALAQASGFSKYQAGMRALLHARAVLALTDTHRDVRTVRTPAVPSLHRRTLATSESVRL